MIFPKFKNSSTFPRQQFSISNSWTFQGFLDLYEPCMQNSRWPTAWILTSCAVSRRAKVLQKETPSTVEIICQGMNGFRHSKGQQTPTTIFAAGFQPSLIKINVWKLLKNMACSLLVKSERTWLHPGELKLKTKIVSPLHEYWKNHIKPGKWNYLHDFSVFRPKFGAPFKKK